MCRWAGAPCSILSIDIGSTPNTCDVPGASQSCELAKASSTARVGVPLAEPLNSANL